MSLATESKTEVSQKPLSLSISDRWILTWQHVVLCGCLAAFFVYLSYIPIFHTDIWGHVLYGKEILQNGAIPQVDPFMPLSDGMRVIDNAWLGQAIFAKAESVAGPQGMSALFALTVLATYAVYARIFILFSGRPLMAVLGLGVLFFVNFTRHAIIRPEIFGGLCLALLFWMIVRLDPWRSRTVAFADKTSDGRWPIWIWVAVPAMFLFWANTHGSFAVGLVVLGCHAVGSSIEAIWRTRNPLAIVRESTCRRWIVLTELALLATLVNPYGLDLLIQTARFGGNPNLRDVLEWYPLKLIDLEGIQFGIALIGLMFVLRHSRCRMHPTDVVLLAVFGISVAPSIRMIGWFAPVFAFVLMPHLCEIAARIWPRKVFDMPAPVTDSQEPTAFSRLAGTLICGLLVWSSFALSPISQPLLGGTPREREQVLSRDTPLGVAKFLREHPPEGLVFAPQWWGDFLVYDGPPEMKVFMTTNLHLIPHQAWKDYLRVARGQTGWERTLDKYDVRTLIVHKELQSPLVRGLPRASKWKTVYEDSKGLVLERRS